MTERNLMELAVLWGPGILILVGFYLLLRRPPQFVGDFIEAQKAQAVAMSAMAAAIQAMAARTDALEQIRTQRLDELLVGQQLMLSRMEALDRRLNDGLR